MKTRFFVASAFGVAALAGVAFAAADLTREGALAEARAQFAKRDANKDGKLDAADRDVHRQQMTGTMFDRVDTNRDGSISRDEWNAGATRLAEVHGGPRHMLKMGRPARPMPGDTDADQAISLREFEAQALERFTRADANKDGLVTLAERMTERGLTPLHVTRD
jgi:hypothetical protein